jgi:glycosyltransferase involved in cell wall biosynthesis
VPRADVPTLGFVGRLVPEKGADLVIRALARLPVRVQLEIVGEGTERTRLELLAAQLGVRDRVIFRGSVPAALMPEALNRFDLLVVPSRTRRNWKEQFGRVIIEAMACGVPVVGSSSGEIPHVIGDPSLIFPEDDVEALARLLATLLANPERLRELGETGRRRVLAHYTQRRIAEQYYAVYQAMLAAPRARHSTAERS